MPQISQRELDRLKHALNELTTLNKIANAVNVTMSVDKITAVIVDQCCQRNRAAQGAIFLLDEEDKDVNRFKTFVRESTSDDQLPFHLNQSLLGWMIKNKAVLVSNDPKSDERLPGVDFDAIGLRSLMAAPLLSRQGLLGLLVLFNKAGDKGFDDLDKRFLGIVGTQVAKVIENARLFKREAQLEEIEKEMRVAHNIQQGFLPKSHITTNFVEATGFNDPAKDVGGDYYDLIELNDDNIFIAIGDVSGKGLPAALLTGNAQAVLRSQLHQKENIDLPAMAVCLNDLVCSFTAAEQYITAIFGIFYSSEKRFSYINAGHLPPAIVRKDGSLELPDKSNIVIGVLPGITYNSIDVELNEGDAIYLYTDGITEATSESGDFYGEERFEDFLRKNCGFSTEVNSKLIREELGRFRGKAEQSDDITMLGLKFV